MVVVVRVLIGALSCGPRRARGSSGRSSAGVERVLLTSSVRTVKPLRRVEAAARCLPAVNDRHLCLSNRAQTMFCTVLY